MTQKQDRRFRATGYASGQAWSFVGAALCACLLAFALAWWVESRIADQARTELSNSLQTVLDTTASAVESWLSEREAEATVWASQPDVREATAQLLAARAAGGDLSTVPAQQALLVRLEPLIDLHDYESFEVVATDGTVIASDHAEQLGRPLEHAIDVLDRLRSGMRPALVELPHRRADGQGKATMVAAALIRDENGEVQGALVLDLDPEKEFTEILQRGRMGESGESYAFNREGKLVSDSRFDDDLRAIGLIAADARGILNIEVRDPGGNMVEGYRPSAEVLPLTRMAAAATAGRPGQDLDGYADYRGVPVIGAWTWDEAHGLGITTEIDVAEGYVQLRRMRRVIYGSATATSLLVLAITGLFVQSRRRMAAANADLSQAEERVRTVMTSATDAIICADEQGLVRLWNPAAERMFGRSVENMLGQPFSAIIPQQWREAHDEGFRAMSSSGGLLTRTAGKPVRLDALHADGREFPIELSLGVGTAEGVRLITGFIEDITDKLKLEGEILAARELAEQANQAKSAFLANMSHELRTPMNAILGYSEMLAEECEDDGNEDYLPDLGKIQAAGKHLLSLINDVLDLSKIEAGRMDLYEEDFSVAELVRDVAATTHPLIAKNGNRLEQDLADDLGFAHADVTKLRQGLFNLLSNASKFTKDGIVTLRGRREVRDAQAWLILSVSDTGIGIPADKLAHVFEEFAQADDSTTREYGGTGLGLPLSRRLCQIMGGDLTIESEVGVGSTFTIEIPAGSSAGLDDGEETPSEAFEPSREASAAAGPLILVVDDEMDARELLVRTLESEGYRVETARSGSEALEGARRLRPDLITLDVMMPGMDGWSTLRRLKEDPELEPIPIVMLSIVADRELSLSLGAVEAMPKPIDRKRLRELAKRLVGRTGDGRRALVVEDDPAARELLCRNLRDEGWVVDDAENGAIGLERVAASRPDLILLDLMMPVMDGFEFLTHLRRQDDTRDVPVLVVTAKDLTAEDRERLEADAQRVLQKSSFDRVSLLAQVHALVARPQGESGK